MPDTTRRIGLLLLACAPGLLLASCGDDDDTATPVSTTPVSTTPVSTTPVPTASATTLPPAPPSSTPPSSTPATPLPGTPGSLTIEVTVGVDASADRIEDVPLGSTVRLVLTNPGANDEFHLHDYDLGDGTEVPAGQTATFTFTADRPGDFELESHVTEDVYLVLQVG